jgi:hypothetical protein
MADWRLVQARHRGTLVARVLSRSWCNSPPALNIPSAELAIVAPLLLNSPAAALAWNTLRNAPLDESLLHQLRDAYRFSGLHSEMRAIDLKEALMRLSSAGIEAIVHKGWATARLYPQPGMRTYSDIDLLVRPDQLPATRAALEGRPSNACPIDLAHSEITELDSVNWDALYSRTRIVSLGTANVRILGAEDHLRGLCIHCLKHGVASPLWLVDVAVTIEAAPADFDWDLCVRRRQPQASWVRAALSLAHRLLQADVHGTPILDFLDELPGWLVRSVLRRWSRPPVPDDLPRLASVLKRRAGILEALAWRWPSASQTSVDANAMFTRMPNIHLQLQSVFAPAKLKTFVLQLPAVWRETRGGSSGTGTPRD